MQVVYKEVGGWGRGGKGTEEEYVFFFNWKIATAKGEMKISPARIGVFTFE